MTDQASYTPETIDTTWRPKVDTHFRLQWEEAQGAFVLLYPEGMIKLNPSGGEILSRCNGEKPISQIIADLQTQFPDAQGIEQDILEFLAIAYQRNWLTHG